MSERTDPRIAKTREAIENALVTLLFEKPFERITVQNIIDEARVNRKTFYSHYADKYALADQIIERLLDMLDEAITTRLAHNEGDDDFPMVLRGFYRTMQDNRRPLLAMMNVRTEQHYLRDELEALLKDGYRDRMAREGRANDDDLMFDYLSCYYAATAASSIRWFLRTKDGRALDVIERVARRRDEDPTIGFLSVPFTVEMTPKER